MYGPFSYEFYGDNYRVRDRFDNRIATCWLEENAKDITEMLNRLWQIEHPEEAK